MAVPREPVPQFCVSKEPFEGTSVKIKLLSRKLMREDRVSIRCDLVLWTRQPKTMLAPPWYDSVLVEAFDSDGRLLGSTLERACTLREIKEYCCGARLSEVLFLIKPLLVDVVPGDVQFRVTVSYSFLGRGDETAGRCTQVTRVLKGRVLDITEDEATERIRRDYLRASKSPTRRNLIGLLRHTSTLSQELSLKLVEEKGPHLSRQDRALVLQYVASVVDSKLLSKLIELSCSDPWISMELSRYFFERSGPAVLAYALGEVLHPSWPFDDGSAAEYLVRSGSQEDVFKWKELLGTNELSVEQKARLEAIVEKTEERLNENKGP